MNRRLQGPRLLFRWLVARNWMIENPTTHLRFMRQSGTPQPLALRRREVCALFHAAAASPHKLALRNVALVQPHGPSRVAGGRGDRPDACGSDPEDPGGTGRVRDGKGRKAREVPLKTTVRRAVQDYLATQPEAAVGGRIFGVNAGRRWPLRSVQAVVVRLAQQAGIERMPVSAQTLGRVP